MHVMVDSTTTLGQGSVSISVGEGLVPATKTTSGRKTNVDECANFLNKSQALGLDFN